MLTCERIALPHAVYSILDKGKTVLYIGCSYQPLSRIGSHATTQPWVYDIAEVRIEWFPNELEARRAEARAIDMSRPKYNRLVPDPEGVLMKRQTLQARGDGVHCPKCGKEKENRRDAYCRSCYRSYRKGRKVTAAAARADQMGPFNKV